MWTSRPPWPRTVVGHCNSHQSRLRWTAYWTLWGNGGTKATIATTTALKRCWCPWALRNRVRFFVFLCFFVCFALFIDLWTDQVQPLSRWVVSFFLFFLFFFVCFALCIDLLTDQVQPLSRQHQLHEVYTGGLNSYRVYGLVLAFLMSSYVDFPPRVLQWSRC